jgi:hypothetical protein
VPAFLVLGALVLVALFAGGAGAKGAKSASTPASGGPARVPFGVLRWPPYYRGISLREAGKAQVSKILGSTVGLNAVELCLRARHFADFEAIANWSDGVYVRAVASTSNDAARRARVSVGLPITPGQVRAWIAEQGRIEGAILALPETDPKRVAWFDSSTSQRLFALARAFLDELAIVYSMDVDHPPEKLDPAQSCA